MARRNDDSRQLPLFADVASAAPTPDAAAPRAEIMPAAEYDELSQLRRRLSPHIRLGTSSWSFPGWRGLVYRDAHSESALARGGLAAYARYPLFRAVGIDRTYYAPISVAEFARYAAATPEDFQFLAKAHEAVTSPTLRTRGAGGVVTSTASPHFFDATYASEHVVGPFVEGLREKAGPLVFQFVPMSRKHHGGSAKFIRRLREFLAALPRGPLYCVEIRNRELLTPEYADTLRATGVCHAFNVHPSMPTIAEQRECVGARDGAALVVRWMLHHGHQYDTARAEYAPFDRLVDEDPESRHAIATLALEAAARSQRVFVIINNKAEGSAPLSVVRLAKHLAEEARVP